MDDSWAMVTFPNGGRLSFVLKEHRDGTRTSYITDPDGNVVELLLDNKV